MSEATMSKYLIIRDSQVLGTEEAEDPAHALMKSVEETVQEHEMYDHADSEINSVADYLLDRTGYEVFKLATDDTGNVKRWSQDEVGRMIRSHHLSGTKLDERDEDWASDEVDLPSKPEPPSQRTDTQFHDE